MEPSASGSGAMSTLELDDGPNVIGTSAWIERDQFVYFVTMARELGRPGELGDVPRPARYGAQGGMGTGCDSAQHPRRSAGTSTCSAHRNDV